MPNRVIKDVALTSEKLAKASDAGERLYWRLHQAADDFGRFHGRPDLIRARCFPLMLDTWPSERVRTVRDEIADLRLLILYRDTRDEIVQITNWEQRIRSARSRFPSPDDRHVTVIRPSDDNPDRGTRIEERGSREGRSSPHAGLLLTPGDVRPIAEPRRASALPVPANGFDRFLEVYPKRRHTDEDLARRAWQSLDPTPELADRIVAAVRSQSSSPQWTEQGGRYVPKASAYLSDRLFLPILEAENQARQEEIARAAEAALERERRAQEERDEEAAVANIAAVRAKHARGERLTYAEVKALHLDGDRQRRETEVAAIENRGPRDRKEQLIVESWRQRHPREEIQR